MGDGGARAVNDIVDVAGVSIFRYCLLTIVLKISMLFVV